MFKKAKWDIRFMSMAKKQIASWSKDPNEQVGCLLVSPSRREFAMGYNGFPQNIEDKCELLEDKEHKNLLMVHAELNAILNARRDLTGWTLYVTKPPCVNCAKAIIQSGIVRVLSPEIEATSSWVKSQMEARGILVEAGIHVGTLAREKYE